MPKHRRECDRHYLTPLADACCCGDECWCHKREITLSQAAEEYMLQLYGVENATELMDNFFIGHKIEDVIISLNYVANAAQLDIELEVLFLDGMLFERRRK